MVELDTIRLSADQLAGFAFALVRCSAFLAIAPPFANGGIPMRVRAALAAGLALAMAPALDAPPGIFETAPFIAGLVEQLAVGLALGFLVLMLFSVFAAAGEVLDFLSGFSAAMAYDPMTRASSTPFGRFHTLLATAILFAIDGHVLLVGALVRSYQVAPLSGLRLDDVGAVLTRDLPWFLLMALQIALPLAGALFLTELALGLLARSAPQLNVMVIGFSLKILVVLLLVGIALPALGPSVSEVLARMLEDAGRMVGG